MPLSYSSIALLGALIVVTGCGDSVETDVSEGFSSASEPSGSKLVAPGLRITSPICTPRQVAGGRVWLRGSVDKRAQVTLDGMPLRLHPVTLKRAAFAKRLTLKAGKNVFSVKAKLVVNTRGIPLESSHGIPIEIFRRAQPTNQRADESGPRGDQFFGARLCLDR